VRTRLAGPPTVREPLASAPRLLYVAHWRPGAAAERWRRLTGGSGDMASSSCSRRKDSANVPASTPGRYVTSRPAGPRIPGQHRSPAAGSVVRGRTGRGHGSRGAQAARATAEHHRVHWTHRTARRAGRAARVVRPAPDRADHDHVVWHGRVGKTALAVHWAHGSLDEFPDGQLYLNLRGYDTDRPVEPAGALAALLRSLGMTGAKIRRSRTTGQDSAGRWSRASGC
jgi:hypothetical protein